MRYQNVTIGSDIEYFLKDFHGNPFPVCGLIGGTKDKPKSMGKKDYYITEDNVMVEYNIPYAVSKTEFVDFVQRGFDLSLKYVPPSLKPEVKATLEFHPDLLKSIPQAMQFGCMPDFNAWEQIKNPRPDSNVNFRSAAGHIHLGWDNPDEESAVELIKACDLFASVPSVVEDNDRVRRTLYGKAGAFRFKPYGVEHRVLSNYWIKSPTQIGLIWDRYQQAIKFLNDGNVIDKAYWSMIQSAINNYDVDLCKKLMAEFKIATKPVSDYILKQLQRLNRNSVQYYVDTGHAIHSRIENFDGHGNGIQLTHKGWIQV